MELTREQRLEIYKLAKENFIRMGTQQCGICVELSIASLKTYKIPIFSYEPIEMFPEFNAIKPEGNRYGIGGLFWWPIEDTDSRIKAFDRMIELASNDK